MATGAFVGVGGRAQKIKGIYVGVAGKARKATKGYIGVNGIARLFWALIRGPVLVTPAPTPLSSKRLSLAATSVGNYALFGGGVGIDRNPLYATVDAYNLSLTRTIAAPLSEARGDLAGCSVGNYALFGGGYASSYSAVVDAYNRSLTRSTPTPLSVARYGLTATTVGNYALFAGGDSNSDFSAVVDAYNASLTRSTPTPLSVARWGLLAATSVGNYALVAGGAQEDTSEGTGQSSVVDAYNTSLTRTTPVPLSVARDALAGTTVGDYALFGGGGDSYASNHDKKATALVDAYDASLTHTNPTPLSQARLFLAATSVNGYGIFAGGTSSDYYNVLDTVDAYDTSLTRTTPTKLINPSHMLAATTVGSYALFAGGADGINSWNALDTVDAYTVN